MVDSGTYTPETLIRRQKMAEQLLGMDKPVRVSHWAQGLDELAKGYFGGKLLKEAEDKQKEGDVKTREYIASLLSGVPAPGMSATPAPSPAATPAASAEPMGSLPNMPRGLRNNNPLNIEAGSFTSGQPGFQGSDGRFAKFASIDQGIGAADKLLGVYSQKHGLNTVSGIINRWAPPSDNNPTNAYAATVAKELGVDPNAPLNMNDPNVRRGLISAMAKFENGKPLPQGAQQPQPVQVAQATPQGSSLAARVAEGLRSSDPFVAKAAMGLAETVLKGQMQTDKPTDDVRDYEYARKQGFAGSLMDFIAAKRAGAGEYGLNPVWGVGPDGKPAAIQLGKSGTAKAATLPEGFQIAKDPIKLDVGTEYILLDPQTRQPVGRQPKDLRGAEREKGIGEQQGKEVAAAPGDIRAGGECLSLIEQIRSNPYIDRGTGFSSYGNIVRGTGGYDFENLVQGAKSGAFLQAIQQMRGLGSLSNAEGDAATRAISRMDTATSKEAFLKAVEDYEKIVKQGITRSKARLANPSATVPTSSAPAMTATPAGETERVKRYNPETGKIE